MDWLSDYQKLQQKAALLHRLQEINNNLNADESYYRSQDYGLLLVSEKFLYFCNASLGKYLNFTYANITKTVEELEHEIEVAIQEMVKRHRKKQKRYSSNVMKSGADTIRMKIAEGEFEEAQVAFDNLVASFKEENA